MKKLLAALTVSLATVAFADDKSKAEDTATKAQQEGQKQDDQAIEATDVGAQLRDNTREWAKQAGLSNEDDPREKALYDEKNTFTISGTTKGKPGESIKLQRQGLPDAKLDIRNKTVSTLDGRRVKAKYIPEGSQVRARFNLDGDDAVAVRLEATSPKQRQGVGGSGEEQTEKKDPNEEGLIGAEEVGPEAKKAAEKTGEAIENTAEDVKNSVDGK